MSLAKAEALELTKEFGVKSLELIDAFLALAEDSPGAAYPLEAMQGLISIDTKLQASLSKLQEEQAFYDVITAVQMRTKEKEVEVSKLISSLQKAERRLQGLLNTSTETMQAITLAQKTPLDVNYSARIGGVMRGPTKEESEIFDIALEPFPNAFRINRSRLYAGEYIARDAVSEEKQREIEQLSDNRFNRIVSRPQEMQPIEPGGSLFGDLDGEAPRSHPGSAGGLFADLDDM